MPERKRLNAELRKPAILKAFHSVIEAEGFENASIAKVAAIAQVNPSLIIHYFGTKEKMVMALVDDVLETYARLFQEMPPGKTPEEQLHSLLNLLWSARWQEAAPLSVLFAFHALGQRQPEVHQRVGRLFRAFKAFLTRELTRFAHEGVIQTEDPQASAEGLMALCEGSHYFGHYYTTPESRSAHYRQMIASALAILKSPAGRGTENGSPENNRSTHTGAAHYTETL